VRAATPAAPPPDRPRVAAPAIEPPPVEARPVEAHVEAPAVLIPPPPPLANTGPTPRRSLRAIRPVTARMVTPPQPVAAVPMPEREPEPVPAESSRLRIEEVKNPFD
jgi:hypothetical protein